MARPGYGASALRGRCAGEVTWRGVLALATGWLFGPPPPAAGTCAPVRGSLVGGPYGAGAPSPGDPAIRRAIRGVRHAVRRPRRSCSDRTAARLRAGRDVPR